MAKAADLRIQLTVTKAAKILFGMVGFVSKVASQVGNAKGTLTEILGAAATLTGIGAITGWQYAAIIGGIAVIFAIERQPQVTETEKTVAVKAARLKVALQARKATGTAEVLVDDVLKAL